MRIKNLLFTSALAIPLLLSGQSVVNAESINKSTTNSSVTPLNVEEVTIKLKVNKTWQMPNSGTGNKNDYTYHILTESTKYGLIVYDDGEALARVPGFYEVLVRYKGNSYMEYNYIVEP